MSRILAHRGYWNNNIEKNSLEAIRTALRCGYGFETDLRDFNGEMVISHNIADESCPNAADVFKFLHDYNDRYTFAVNIKADGLKDLLKRNIEEYGITNYFLFDMSVPQMIEFKECGLRFFTRQSEVEQYPSMYDDASGVWIDGFWSTKWITKELITKHLDEGKEVCLVSPELHGRNDYKDFWKALKGYNIDFGKVLLCTDLPDEAKEYFNE